MIEVRELGGQGPDLGRGVEEARGHVPAALQELLAGALGEGDGDRAPVPGDRPRIEVDRELTARVGRRLDQGCGSRPRRR